MLTARHAETLRKVVEATLGLSPVGASLKQHRPLDLNLQAKALQEAVRGKAGDAYERYRSVAHVCGFLIEEFAHTYDGDRGVLIRLIEEKLDCFPTHPGTKIFQKLYREHSAAKGRFTRAASTSKAGSHRTAQIDVLFVTALPVEYWAVLRRIDYYFKGSHPKTSRGIIEEVGWDEGWVVGAMLDERRRVSVGAVCCRKYGPEEATRGTGRLLSLFGARHVFVVGVGASLAGPEEFDLGDLGYSSGVEDIGLQKATEDAVTTRMRLTRAPQWGRLSAGLREQLETALAFDSGELSLVGVLREELVPDVQSLFDSAEDKGAIRVLADLSRARAERLDFEANRKERKCSEGLLAAAGRVASDSKWRSDIWVPKPFGTSDPRAVEVRALSGSMVVKAFGVRDHLRDRFPGRYLLDMEGGGAGTACESHCESPMVVKAACDWGTPAKEKSWQPYCADVAAAFARALALQVAGRVPR